MKPVDIRPTQPKVLYCARRVRHCLAALWDNDDAETTPAADAVPVTEGRSLRPHLGRHGPAAIGVDQLGHSQLLVSPPFAPGGT